MAKKIDLSIIVVSFNTRELTTRCIESVVDNTKGISYEIIVVDNASTDGSIEVLAQLNNRHPLKLISNKENLGFGAANNQGMKESAGRYILLLNSDTLIEGNVLGEMVEYLDGNSDIGIATCSLLNPDGSMQGTGGYFPTLPRVISWMIFIDDIPGMSSLIKPFHPMHENSPLGKNENFYKARKEVDWLTGAFFLMKREVFENVGYFSKDYFMYVEEVDYCFRTKKLGWKIMYLPKWRITHYGGVSSTSEFPILNEFKGIKTFYKRHYPSWQFPVLRLFLKLGALLRILVFGVLKGFSIGKTYAKIFLTI